MRTVEALIRRLAGALALLAGLSLVLMMTQTVAYIVMSRLFGMPIEA